MMFSTQKLLHSCILKEEHFLLGFIKSGFDSVKALNLVDYQDPYNYCVGHISVLPSYFSQFLCILVLLDSDFVLFIRLCVYCQLQDIKIEPKHVCHLYKSLSWDVLSVSDCGDP